MSAPPPTAVEFNAAIAQWVQWFAKHEAEKAVHFAMRLAKKRAEDRRMFESGETAREVHRENEACSAFRNLWHVILAGDKWTADDRRVFRHSRKMAQRRARNAHRRHVDIKHMFEPTKETP
jgi:hypothetical protein